MKRRLSIADSVAAILVAAGLLLLVGAVMLKSYPADSDRAARRVERALSARMSRLERIADNPPSKLPDDMIVYHYSGDTLRSWHNQFTVCNDELSDRHIYHRLINPRIHMHSPLSELTDSLGFYNFGPGWYLAKAISSGDGITVIGLEVMSTAPIGGGTNVNPHVRLGHGFSIQPVSQNGGAAVVLEGTPQFKVLRDTLAGTPLANAVLIWAAMALVLAALFVFIFSKRTLLRFGYAALVLAFVTILMYIWGRSAQSDFNIFSPTLYAGGKVLYSLGAVVLANLCIVLLSGGLYLVRKDIQSRIKTRRGAVMSVIGLLVAIIGLLVYSHITFRSIIQDSSISLELYNFDRANIWTAVVYLSFLSMLLSIPLLLSVGAPAVKKVFGLDIEPFSTHERIIFATLTAVYMVMLAASSGFGKEKRRIETWAGRLAVDRDISLELQLRRVENQIAGDMFIGPLSAFDNAAATIRGRILDSYLTRLGQEYDVNVYVLGDLQANPQAAAFFNDRVRGGTPIADGSHFICSELSGGRFRYDGSFFYYVEGAGVVTMLLEVEPIFANADRGYSRLIGASRPGKVSIPGFYSFARYSGRELQVFNGSYAYATTMPDALYSSVYESGLEYLKADGYTHFINRVTPDESVIISRPTHGVFSYLIAVVFIALAAFLLFSIPATRASRSERYRMAKGYYRTRIIWVLEISLVLTLIVMAMVSVLFVYRRNEANLRTIMSDKLGSVQTMVQNGIDGREGNLRSRETLSMLDEVAAAGNVDITLYGPDGKMIISTKPELFDNQILGCRVDESAYLEVIDKCKRYHIQKESIGRRSFYCMYAPLMDSEGHIAAILSCPYTGDETFGFEHDALMHSATVVTLFLIMLLLSRLVVTSIVGRMFGPLDEMGRKMNSAGLDSLELIEYHRNDEISSLVQAYNRMVTELSESSRKLAQAERDKAWSGMARQVAHEIKNPLTPMKLQLQRIMRLKKRDAEGWEDKFDEVADILLDHIDILTETANEFSSFAKLYTEEPTLIDLDAVLKEEISMFDGKDGVRFDYMGLDGASVMGPKPQLTRVFVNLLGNAVQALGEKGGRIMVSLRHSVEDGFYDIVVEDDGPGVSAENIDKLFTPNFTTKTGGSGLGLAISRSVLEKCGATISYSRSFSLGGACFTIKYPR